MYLPSYHYLLFIFIVLLILRGNCAVFIISCRILLESTKQAFIKHLTVWQVLVEDRRMNQKVVLPLKPQRLEGERDREIIIEQCEGCSNKDKNEVQGK